jgi:hypothetical protein
MRFAACLMSFHVKYCPTFLRVCNWERWAWKNFATSLPRRPPPIQKCPFSIDFSSTPSLQVFLRKVSICSKIVVFLSTTDISYIYMVYSYIDVTKGYGIKSFYFPYLITSVLLPSLFEQYIEFDGCLRKKTCFIRKIFFVRETNYTIRFCRSCSIFWHHFFQHWSSSSMFFCTICLTRDVTIPIRYWGICIGSIGIGSIGIGVGWYGYRHL